MTENLARVEAIGDDFARLRALMESCEARLQREIADARAATNGQAELPPPVGTLNDSAIISRLVDGLLTALDEQSMDLDEARRTAQTLREILDDQLEAHDLPEARPRTVDVRGQLTLDI